MLRRDPRTKAAATARTINIINAMYGADLRPSKRGGLAGWFFPKRTDVKAETRMREKHLLALYKERNHMLTKGRLAFVVATAIAATAFAVSIFYFNGLTRSEQDVLKENAKIDSLLQRRRNISINLARTVRDYATHEAGIFRHVSNRRGSAKDAPGGLSPEDIAAGIEIAKTMDAPMSTPAGVPGAAPAQGPAKAGNPIEEVLAMLEGTSGVDVPLDKKLAGLMAVAESYPDLKLSGNFQRFMDALVETEKELSDRRMQYSDVVNTYTTQLMTFPGNMFARAYGFDPVPYFMADTEAKGFRPVDY